MTDLYANNLAANLEVATSAINEYLDVYECMTQGNYLKGFTLGLEPREKLYAAVGRAPLPDSIPAGWQDPVIEMGAKAARLQAFKDYVHKRLDEMGVPADPEPSKTAETGCRIGPRLDWVQHDVERLANWQRFASYCRSCAVSGESDPMDFCDFLRGEQERTATAKGE
jgi:hypothetical protein